MTKPIEVCRNIQDVRNKHGLRTSKLNGKLRSMLSNTQYYTPKEVARDLVKMAFEIDPVSVQNTLNKLMKE